MLTPPEIAKRLRLQFLGGPYELAKIMLAYTGIVYVLARRWATYKQVRSIFKRTVASWVATGDDPTEVASAVVI